MTAVPKEAIAEKLKALTEKGKTGLETQVQSGNFLISVQWFRGKIPCPFGDPGVHQKIVTTVMHQKLNKTIRFSQLSVHLIEVHGFFAGKGSAYRLEPEELVEFLLV